MQSTSVTYQTLLAGTHRKEVRLIVNDNLIYGEDAIYSMSVSGALFGADTLSFGGCVSREIRVKFLPGAGVIPRMAKLEPQIRLKNGSTVSEWIPKGVYYIDTREYDRETGTLTLTGYDAMLKAEADYIATGDVGTWPRSMASVAAEIASLLGLTVDSRTRLNSYDVQLPAGYSMREVLGYIAAAHAGNWVVTDEGKLRLIRADDTADVIAVGRDITDYTDDEAFETITHAEIDTDEDTYVEAVASPDNGRLLRLECPWATAAIAQAVLSSLSSFVYQPFDARGANLNPAGEIGDRVTVNGVNSVLAVQTLTFNSLCLSDISAPGEDELDHEYPYEAVGVRKIERKIKGVQATFRIETDAILGRVEDLEEESVASVAVEYAVGNSSSTAPETGWSTASPTWTAGSYIWQRTVTTYADGNTSVSSPTCIQGAAGTSGVGISSVVPEYYLSTSASSPTGGSWSTTPPAWASGKYIWTRSHIYWSDNTDTTTTPVLDNAVNGLGQKYSELKQTVDGFTLTVTNGSMTSTIKLMSGSTVISSQTIQFSGVVSFTDLSTAGSTRINGANITTGKISADRIDTASLHVETIYYTYNQQDYTILSTFYDGGNIITHLGSKTAIGTSGETQDINIYARFCCIGNVGAGNDLLHTRGSLIISPSRRCIDVVDGSAASRWDIGTDSSPFGNIYCVNVAISPNGGYYLDWDGGATYGYIDGTANGPRWIDANGRVHYLALE